MSYETKENPGRSMTKIGRYKNYTGNRMDNMDEAITEQNETTLDLDETWTKLRDTVYHGALGILGTTTRKHCDCFDENVAVAATMLRKMHESHLQWINGGPTGRQS